MTYPPSECHRHGATSATGTLFKMKRRRPGQRRHVLPRRNDLAVTPDDTRLCGCGLWRGTIR